MIRALRCLMGVATVGLLLSACGGIPAVGPVTDGPRLGDSRSGGLIVPPGPEPGAGPERIVKGFIQAGGGFDKEHQVARSYLTSSVQTTWRPDAQVTVYPRLGKLTFQATSGPAETDSEPSRDAGSVGTGDDTVTEEKPAQPGTALVSVTVPVAARVSADGALTNGAADEQVTLDYTVQYTSGLGWRIAKLDDGILLSQQEFIFTYSDVKLYFPDRTGQYLVPDVRWFPSTVQGSLATRAVRELLEGPVGWLDPAVSTGFPVGTAFAGNTVPVEEGEATVDITDRALTASKEQHRLLLAQLGATLSGITSAIERVKVTVNQASYDSTSASTTSFTGPTLLRRSGSGGMRPVAVTKTGKLVTLADRGAVPVKGVGALNDVHGTRPAASPTQRMFALLSADRTQLYVGEPRSDRNRPGIEADVALTGVRLVAPSFDPQGWVWTASESAGGRLLVALPGKRRSSLDAPWLDGATVTGVRLSRDGSRVAIAVEREQGASVLVAAVTRDAQGAPKSLGTPLDVLPDLSRARAVVWTGEASLVILGVRADLPEQPWEVQVGGQPEPTLAVPSARSLAANQPMPGSSTELYVGVAGGRVFKREGGQWVKVASASWPALPG
jgi:hypothetical protein